MPQETIRLPDTSKLVVSSSPHVHQNQDARRVMLTVLLALAPACLVGVYYFGLRALWVLGVCTVSALLFEALFCRLFNRPVVLGDMSALLTGVLLGMNLSAYTPWWVCVIGSLLAIGLGKQLYGGLGYNPFNPALVGRVGLVIAFPKLMTTWIEPKAGQFITDATTTATPLGQLQTDGIQAVASVRYLDLFIGNMPGCIGETSAAALILGGLLLVFFRLIRWQIPVIYIGTVAVVTGAVHAFAPELSPEPLFHLLTGGLMLGAIFMATDMVTSPMTKSGAIIFALGCGLMTAVIRIWGSYPEGVSFSILFMNALVPLIDRYTASQPFGYRKRAPAAA